jgi:hypothetical protein
VPERPVGGGTANDRGSWAGAMEQNLLMQEAAERMLKKDAVFGGKTPTFFTDTWDGFGKDDPDEAAYKNLQTFGNSPRGTDAYENYWKSMDILGTFTDTEREYVNKNNSINTVVNDAMTDKTGQRLVELLTELRDNTKELHLEER